jgi:ribosomal protein S12 methylthiotransferase
MRGKHVSVPMEQLVMQAKNLARQGVKELILIAQDLTFYGLDIYSTRSLSELVRRLSDVDGVEWIRLHYAFPSGFPMDVLDAMNERKNICKYLDIPFQHISDNMLQSMRRGITKEKTISLLDEIRQKVPGIALRTTLMVGYPGETEKDFEELIAWIAETKFDRLGVFTYSHEENTHAFSLEDTIPQEVKQSRAEEIMLLQQQLSGELNVRKIGKTFRVIFDKKEGPFFVGRTEVDSPEIDNEVLVDAKNNYVRIGDFSEVKITAAGEYDLTGEVIS